MKLFALAFLLSFFAALPAISDDANEYPETEIEIQDDQLTSHEETEALLSEEDEIIDTGSTVGNGVPMTPDSEETTI